MFLNVDANAQRIKAWHEQKSWDKITPYQFKTDSLTAEEALLVADALFRMQKASASERVLLKIEKQKNYKTHELYWQLTQVYLAQGESVKALEAIEKALKTQPQNRAYLHTRAGLLYQLKNYRGAQTEYQILHKTKNADYKSFIMTFQCMVAQENYREAYKFMTRFKDLYKTPAQKTEILEELIKLQWYHYKNLDSAFHFLAQAEVQKLDSEQLKIYRMVLHNQKGNFTKAEGAFNEYKRDWKAKKLSAGALKKQTVLFDEYKNEGVGYEMFRSLASDNTYSVFLRDGKGMYLIGKVDITKVHDGFELLARSKFNEEKLKISEPRSHAALRDEIHSLAKKVLKLEE